MDNQFDYHARAFRNAAKALEHAIIDDHDRILTVKALTYLAIAYQDEANRFALTKNGEGKTE